MFILIPIISQNKAFEQRFFLGRRITNRRTVWQDGWAMRLIIIGGPDAMKTAIEKPVTPGGVFDHLMVP